MKNLTTLMTALLISGCGPSAEQLEESRLIAKQNGEYNLKQFSKTLDDVVEVINQSDSTIGPECPNGDGWVSGTITMVDGSKKDAKCQTNGSSKGVNGCLLVQDFNKKAYSDQDGRCDKSIKSLKLVDALR